MKYAVYVEGQSEMCFVADVLQKYSNFESELIGFRCINLRKDSFVSESYPSQGGLESNDYYQIVNVNNDTLVLSKLRQDIQGLLAQNFEVIIGLKDVYGASYNEMVGRAEVNRNAIEQMHSIQFGAINHPDADLRLHYAIMEFEAWMLALLNKVVTSRGLDLAEICRGIGIDFSLDPETTIFHPTQVVKQIYEAMGDNYGKHRGDIIAFLSTLTRDDYEWLRHSGRCASFGKFLDSLFGAPKPVLP